MPALEVADINVLPGSEDDFAAAYRGAREVLATTPGCLSVRMTRGIESPSRFTLLVEWDSVEAHETNFRATERFGHLACGDRAVLRRPAPRGTFH